MSTLEIGLTHTSSLLVDQSHTAIAMASGDMEVLATPAMMALMENAAMMAVADAIPKESTTVGAHIESSHLRPTLCGHKIAATAVLIKIEGPKLFFNVTAIDDSGNIIGQGTHLRFIVNKAKFLSRL